MFKVSYLAFVLIAGSLFSAPYILDSYGLGLMVGIASYVGLATAWSIFSGPTRYISLATVAFYGVGAYTMAVLGEHLAYPVILVVSLAIGAVLSLIVGIATLRLAGVYFVIFSFGLTELVVQLVTWFEVNVTGELGRYIFLDLETRHIYWMLLSIAILTLIISWGIKRSRIGLALRVIGDDEMVAKHSGIHITNIKLILFALSASIMTLIGAVQAPRWVYVEPSIVFNPVVSFLTVIMALFGGSNRLFGPVFGVIPLFLLFEWLSANFPNHYSIILGILFIGIVFVLPRGVLAFFEENFAKISNRIGKNSAKGDIK